MATLFISDLHLTGERPQIISLFEDFINNQAYRAEALYILGDLFEMWLGDDAITPDIQPVITSLAKLTSAGIPVYVIVGNRDFLLGDKFTEMSGCRLLPETSIIDLYGTPTLLLHGDTLCTDDHEYQDFRRIVRNPEWIRNFLNQSIAERLAYGRKVRQESQTRSSQKPEEIVDVNAQAVKTAFKEHNVQRMIHGHTHRPAIHRVELEDGPATRIVLGDWYDQSSILTVDENGFQLTGQSQTTWY